MASKQRQPVLGRDLAAGELDTLEDVDLEGVRLDGCDLAKRHGSRMRLDSVRWIGGALSESKVAELSWLDVECERCDLCLVEWPAAKLTRVVFRDCRATGARWSEAELEDVRFVGCQLECASFAGARFRRVSFEQCRLRDADFGGADLAGTIFGDCELHGVDLLGAKLAGADVHTSSLREVRIDARDMRGLVVSREQAAVLAQLLGLVVRDS
jgi:uncharacterized protein YjbI with pentapeptide repeats